MIEVIIVMVELFRKYTWGVKTPMLGILCKCVLHLMALNKLCSYVYNDLCTLYSCTVWAVHLYAKLVSHFPVIYEISNFKI